MPFVLPLAALISAAGLQWTSWGQGRFNWGPRLGALWLLVVGQVLFVATPVGSWLRDGIAFAAHWADVGVTYLLGGAAGTAIAYLVTWLPAAILGVYWLVAMSPWGNERTTWRIAWAGTLLPAFAAAIPGPAGNALDFAFTALAGVGATILAVLFGWASTIRGAV